ncbi:MAG: DUF2802 domain-containing protein [Gammaproteobacteria bacterium]|nr:DUF2802 domain-containing protein [Gammaproteobacteria bacterium]
MIITVTEIAAIVVAILFAGLWGGCLIIMRRQSQTMASQARQQREEIDGLRSQIEVIGSGSVGMGKRLDKLGRDLSWLQEQVQQLSMSREAQVSYDSAIRLAENGAGVEGLMQNCQMTEAEAELVLKMHASRSRLKSDQDKQTPSLYSLANRLEEIQ